MAESLKDFLCDELLEWLRDDNDDDDIDQVLKAASDDFEESVTATNSATQVHAFPSLPVYSCTNYIPMDHSCASSSSPIPPGAMSNSAHISSVIPPCTYPSFTALPPPTSSTLRFAKPKTDDEIVQERRQGIPKKNFG